LREILEIIFLKIKLLSFQTAFFFEFWELSLRENPEGGHAL